MSYIGVCVAIIKSGQILLTRREDFEVWCLPGGHVEDGESLAQAAAREALEETGLEVELTRLVGVYSRPRWNDGGQHIVVFAARPIGGALKPQEGEVLETRYFDPNGLPEILLLGHSQRIIDALNGVGGSVVWSHDTPWPFEQGLKREELYALRDQSGLSRQEFYLKFFGHSRLGDDRLEVGGNYELW
jgi:ADP-ribose pyrophosphatase YjhB (NUDIX family)